MTYTYRKDDTQEVARLQTLLSYNILNTPSEEEFNNLVKIVSLICNSPIALISFIDDEKQWYKAKTGINQDEAPRAETLCQYTLLQDDIMEIPDTRLDERSKNSDHVIPMDGIRFYAGVNLKASNGSKIGTVCVVDSSPKKLNEDQKQALRLIAEQTMTLLETRKKNKKLGDELENILQSKIKETQRQLLQKETEYNILLNAIKKSNGVVEFSPDGNIRAVNDNFLNITGYTRKEVLGQNHEIFLHEDQKEENNKFWNSLRNGKFLTGRLRRKHKDGTSIWIQASYNPLTNEQNEVLKIVKITQDITKKIEAEKALKKSKDLADFLNIQKDNFIANMSHEIRTPIHAILGFTELLLEQEKNSAKKSYLKAVKTAGDNLLYIINDILDLSKIEAGIIQLEKEPFDLSQLVQNVFSILHLKAHQKKLNFHFEIHSSVHHYLLGDRNRLTQILLNLLGNAIKFTNQGRVCLSVTVTSNMEQRQIIEFKIEDTGIGIPEDKKELIFNRFSQAEEDTSRKFGGTGLGLNISRHLIEKQGGEIFVESKEGEGSIFRFYLLFEKGTPPGIVEHRTTTAPVINKNINILLCEDNELNQRLIKTILKAQGYQIDLAENGLKGIELLQKKSYDLILMDIQMPVMDAYEATRIIRQELKLLTPIVALTANFMLAEKIKCRELGMDNYLSKPFTKDDILAKISGHIDGHEDRENIMPAKRSTGPALNLENLNELTGNDKEFKEEMIHLLIQQAGKMQFELEAYAREKNIVAVRATAHKFKTSFGVIGADPGLLDQLENYKEEGMNTGDLEKIIIALGQQLEDIFSILNKHINAPQK